MLREHWFPGYMQTNKPQMQVIAHEVAEQGFGSGVVLDTSCGLGLRTMKLRQLGLRLHGADRAPQVIEWACKLAEEARFLDVQYFAAEWRELADHTSRRYPVVFNDTLPLAQGAQAGLVSDLRGIRRVMTNPGLLVYEGAPYNLPCPGQTWDEKRRERWGELVGGRSTRRLSHRVGTCSVSETRSYELAAKSILHHFAYVARGPSPQPMAERTTLCESFDWDLDRAVEALVAAGMEPYRCLEISVSEDRRLPLLFARV
jgi:hypothetical protein